MTSTRSNEKAKERIFAGISFIIKTGETSSGFVTVLTCTESNVPSDKRDEAKREIFKGYNRVVIVWDDVAD